MLALGLYAFAFFLIEIRYAFEENDKVKARIIKTIKSAFFCVVLDLIVTTFFVTTLPVLTISLLLLALIIFFDLVASFRNIIFCVSTIVRLG